MTLRPSSLPMLAQCAQFEGGGGNIDTESGTDRHSALAALLNNDTSLVDLLDEEDADAVKWFADYIRLHAPMADYPLEIEVHVNPVGPDFEPLFPNGGTEDTICGPNLFDLKWRPRDYSTQMAAYALDLFDRGHEKVRVHVGYGAVRRVDVYDLDEPTARNIVNGVMARVALCAPPTPCDYCGWCASRLTCKPYARTAKFIAQGYADEPLLSQVKNWHPSEMKSAEEIALGLTIARKLLAPWCKSMEHHAREAAIKGGMKLPGFELKEKSGKSHVSDVSRAHELLALPVVDFLKCCDLRMNTSKKYPDRIGVIDTYAKVWNLKKTPAGREVKQKLSEVITTGKPTLSLVAIGGEEEENEE